jgi:uncharacterized caspase-like protein
LPGNEAYGPSIGALGNPHNDVALVEQALKRVGFEVLTMRDAGFAVLHQAINSYARRLRRVGPGTVGFLYYSGHGAQDGVKRYREGILRWFDSQIANGLIEGINSLVQAAKAKARGYRSLRNLVAITYLIAGKIDLRLAT